MGKDDWANTGMILKTWMNYSGPHLAEASKYTTAKNGETNTTLQQLDTILTTGYHLPGGIVPGIGIPFAVDASDAGFQMRPPYVGIIEAQVLHASHLNVFADARVYLPVGDEAAEQELQTGFRTSQTVIYDVPGSRLILGWSSYVRVAFYGNHGKGHRRDLDIAFTPFAKMPLSKTISAVLWSGWLQLGHEVGKPAGLDNFPLNIQPGIRWDFSPRASINPYLSLLPSNWAATSLGMVINVRLL